MWTPRLCAIAIIMAGLFVAGQSQARGGNDHAGGHGNGHGNGHGQQSDDVASTEIQGSLNAAHASATARAHAAPNSRVGKIASYESAIQAGDIAAAGASLADAANKTIIGSMVHAVNDLLGIDAAPVATGGTVHDTEADVSAAAAQ